MTSARTIAPLLRVPPFPGSKVRWLARKSEDAPIASDAEVDRVIAALTDVQVGGTYWAGRPDVPATAYTLVRTGDAAVRRTVLTQASRDRPVVLWDAQGVGTDTFEGKGVQTIRGSADPWFVVAGASQVVVDSDDEIGLIAALTGAPVRFVGDGAFVSAGEGPAGLRQAVREQVIDGLIYLNPFTGEAMSLAEAIDLSAFWRKLVDSNRDLTAAVGFAFWKRPTVAPLLWNGTSDVPFETKLGSPLAGDRIAVWKARTNRETLRKLESSDAYLMEVEDGFIRSAGLGADCIPPLSIVVDRLGIYFDPNSPSEMERLLNEVAFTSEIVQRAGQLRNLIVQHGVSKYESGTAALQRSANGRRHILVPGQVEDDRSVLAAGGVRTNLDLLRRVRENAPEAYIIYKPHPDVEAGHRTGAIADATCLTLADEIVRDAPIAALIDMVDEVHVNTSLAGFEALLREKPVTTYGVPFYAGWGLTRDLGEVPARRKARRSLDQLVAAALLLYPRYLDPDTGLPCPPEVLVHRLSDRQEPRKTGPVVQLRRLQGRINRLVSGLRAP